MISSATRETCEQYFDRPTDHGVAEEVCKLVGSVGVYGTFTVAWWRDGTHLVTLDQRRNPNTPAIMWEKNGELGYPWPPGRAFKAGGQIPTIWDRVKGEVSAVSSFGEARCIVPKGDPDLEIVMDVNGARVIGRKAA